MLQRSTVIILNTNASFCLCVCQRPWHTHTHPILCPSLVGALGHKAIMFGNCFRPFALTTILLITKRGETKWQILFCWHLSKHAYTHTRTHKTNTFQHPTTPNTQHDMHSRPFERGRYSNHFCCYIKHSAALTHVRCTCGCVERYYSFNILFSLSLQI